MALARAALESAAQAVWLMNTRDPIECVKRHLRLVRWDLQEQRKSYLDLEDKDRVRRRDSALVERVAKRFAEEEIRPPAGYLWVIQQACEPTDLDATAGNTERLWRAMSGAAHGMYWTNIELTNIEVKEERGPSNYRTQLTPDPKAMLEALEVAYKMTQYGVLKYLAHAGADIAARFGPARQWLAANITLKTDAPPEARSYLAGEG